MPRARVSQQTYAPVLQLGVETWNAKATGARLADSRPPPPPPPPGICAVLTTTVVTLALVGGIVATPTLATTHLGAGGRKADFN